MVCCIYFSNNFTDYFDVLRYHRIYVFISDVCFRASKEEIAKSKITLFSFYDIQDATKNYVFDQLLRNCNLKKNAKHFTMKVSTIATVCGIN